MKHLDEFDTLMKKGVGLCCIHYAVEIPKGRPGDLMKDWIGGYFETSGRSIRTTWRTSTSCPIIRLPAASSRSNQRRVVLSHAIRGRHAGCDGDTHRLSAG